MSEWDAFPLAGSVQQPTAAASIWDAFPLASSEPKLATADFLSAGDVASQAFSNIVPSAVKLGHDIVQPILHPIDTAKSLAGLGAGLGQKAYRGVMGGEPGSYEQYPDAVGKALTERYGGLENIKKTIATDPVGALFDTSILLTGGGMAAARAPGIIGKTGNAIVKAGATIDPFTPVLAAGGKVASNVIGSLGTHTGAASLETAFKSGQKGDRVFLENLRGQRSMEDVVAEAKSAVDTLRSDRGKAYEAGMATTKLDTTVLDFTGISKAAQQVADVGKFKNVPIDPKTHVVKGEIAEIVDGWRRLNPAEYHTAEGFDALKRAVGEIKDAAPFNSPERLVAGRIYNAIRDTIVKQAPEYAKTMKDYERASTQIKEIERALSLRKQAAVDTALRKLQSIMRNNVSSNYGNRDRLVQMLLQKHPDIMPALAGQSLSSWSPRGLAGKAWAMAGAGAGLFANPQIAATLPFMSPRLMGETAYYTGKFMPSIATRQDAVLAGRNTQPHPNSPFPWGPPLGLGYGFSR